MLGTTGTCSESGDGDDVREVFAGRPGPCTELFKYCRGKPNVFVVGAEPESLGVEDQLMLRCAVRRTSK